MKNIVACVDFSPASSAVVDAALNMATAFNAKLYLLTVVPSAPPAPGYERRTSETLAGRIEHARDALAELRKPLLAHGIDVSTVLIPNCCGCVDPIVEEAQTLGADLIVIGARGHTELHRRVMGSTAQGVVRAAGCAVLVVPTRLEEIGSPESHVTDSKTEPAAPPAESCGGHSCRRCSLSPAGQ